MKKICNQVESLLNAEQKAQTFCELKQSTKQITKTKQCVAADSAEGQPSHKQQRPGLFGSFSIICLLI